MRASLLALLLPCLALGARTLDLYFVDVEGGQATLIVTPSKQTMLVDAGFPGYSGRDAERIKKAAKAADVKELDYLWTTHYHLDHVGGVPAVIERLPVKTFVDHGPNRETGKAPGELTEAYAKASATGKRLSLKAGDKLPMKGVEITAVTADGEAIAEPLKGAGEKNALCGSSEYPEDPGENARSLGFVLQYGRFRFVDLGDLTSRKELGLVCPANKIGIVDVYLSTHHGLESSNAKELVHSLQPRVVIMNNGAKKGGAPKAWQIMKSSPRLQDLWQVHFSIAGGKENNSPEPMIANLVENCEGGYLKLSVSEDGSFTVFNSRNKYEKKYAAQ